MYNIYIYVKSFDEVESRQHHRFSASQSTHTQTHIQCANYVCMYECDCDYEICVHRYWGDVVWIYKAQRVVKETIYHIKQQSAHIYIYIHFQSFK